jgi:acetoin utilization deacetylase AcuC-like enzyme
VHDARYVSAVERAIASGARVLDEGDTRVSADSWRAALCAAGGAVRAVDAVIAGEWKNAFVAARPPGHHAERAEAMGFCMFNNAAVAAMHAIEARGLSASRSSTGTCTTATERSTSSSATRASSTRACTSGRSIRQPDSRRSVASATRRHDIESAATSGAGDGKWLTAFENELLPALEDFSPELVIVSAGFDAHADDPLAQTKLSTDAYARMTQWLLDLAAKHANGRVVSLLEGGYDLTALADSVETHVRTLVDPSRDST